MSKPSLTTYRDAIEISIAEVRSEMTKQGADKDVLLDKAYSLAEAHFRAIADLMDAGCAGGLIVQVIAKGAASGLRTVAANVAAFHGGDEDERFVQLLQHIAAFGTQEMPVVNVDVDKKPPAGNA